MKKNPTASEMGKLSAKSRLKKAGGKKAFNMKMRQLRIDALAKLDTIPKVISEL